MLLQSLRLVSLNKQKQLVETVVSPEIDLIQLAVVKASNQ